MSSRGIIARGLAKLAYHSQLLADRLTPAGSAPTLAGDRDIEWSWVATHLRESPGQVLDFGAGIGFASLAASFHGHEVVAVDLEPCQFRFEAPTVRYVRGDLIQLELEPESFDQVVNCSTIEHVGIAGRYGSTSYEEGDFVAMRKLIELLRPGGEMLLTLPVGLGGVFPPHHRVYDARRLERLLVPLQVVEERYWAKSSGARWEEVDRATATTQVASASYYGIGTFVLRKTV